MLNLDNHPIDVTTLTVTDFSIQGFADTAREAAVAARESVVIPIAGGATASFVGLLVGAVNAGCVPQVVPVGKDDVGVLTSMVDLDLIRWLARRRMWAAIAALPDSPEDVAAAARDLDRYERFESTSLPDLPADRLHRLVASTVSEWAADERLWLTGLSGIVDKITQRLADQLPPSDRAELKSQVAKWRQRLERLPKGDVHDADIALQVARQHPPQWNAWQTAPSGLKTWIDRFAILPQTNKARHGRLGENPQSERRADTQSYRTLSAISRAQQPPLRQSVRDAMPRLALEHLGAGLPDTPVPGARLALRLAGRRNVSGVIDREIEHHHTDAVEHDEVALPVVVVASADTAVDGAIVIDPHQVHDSTTTSLDQIRQRCTELELQHDCRITTLALYLNQGTKIMNFATLRSSLTVASELGAQLRLFDVAATTDGDSRITPLRTGDVRRLVRRSLPPDQIRRLLHSAIRSLDLAQARALTGLLDDRGLNDEVKALAQQMLWPVDGIADDDWAARISAIAPAVNVLLKNREVIGDRETVARLAVLLSAAVSTQSSEVWKDCEGLQELWKARNAVFHDKPFTYPRDLTRDRLIDLAEHLDVRRDLSTIRWDSAIDKRRALLRTLETSVRA